MMDAIEMLTNDHNKVRELFGKFNGGSGVTGMVRRTIGSVSPQEKRSAREQVCKELEMHTLLEETVFYPAVRALGDQGLEDQIGEALEEHAKVKREVARLRDARGEDDETDEQMSQLEKDVEHHASEEEREMFPRLAQLMREEEREELARRMQALKRGGGRSKHARASAPPVARATRARARTGKAMGRMSAGRTHAGAKPGGAAKRTRTNKRASARKQTAGRARGKARSGRR